jgi:drug/metabolite transporter (DMT)-like permease
MANHPGAIAYSATVFLFVLATKLTTAANAIFLQYTAPIYIAMISPWFLGERTKWHDWLLVLLPLFGIVLSTSLTRSVLASRSAPSAEASFLAQP